MRHFADRIIVFAVKMRTRLSQFFILDLFRHFADRIIVFTVKMRTGRSPFFILVFPRTFADRMRFNPKWSFTSVKLNKAKQSTAKQSKAEQSKAQQSRAKSSKAKLNKAKQSRAKQSTAKGHASLALRATKNPVRQPGPFPGRRYTSPGFPTSSNTLESHGEHP